MVGSAVMALVGFAKFVTPGSEYEPKGFILTTVLGIVGADLLPCLAVEFPSVSHLRERQ